MFNAYSWCIGKNVRITFWIHLLAKIIFIFFTFLSHHDIYLLLEKIKNRGNLHWCFQFFLSFFVSLFSFLSIRRRFLCFYLCVSVQTLDALTRALHVLFPERINFNKFLFCFSFLHYFLSNLHNQEINQLIFIHLLIRIQKNLWIFGSKILSFEELTT